MKRSGVAVGLALGIVSTLLVAAQQERRGAIDVLFAPTGNARKIQDRLSSEIAASKKQVWVAIYQFTSKQIAEALASAARRGVDVRVLADGVQGESGELQGAVFEILKAGGVSVRRVYPEGVGTSDGRKSDASRSKFHHKFCVIDGARVATGSYNYTILADEENHENLLFFTNRPIAAEFARQFELIWNDEKITEK